MATFQFVYAPQGLRPVSRRGSALISPAIQKMNINPATGTTHSIGSNEIVTNATATGATSTAGYIDSVQQSIPVAAAFTNLNGPFLGVFAGCYFKITAFPGEMRQVFWQAGTAIVTGTPVVADVLYDPDIEYEIQVGTGTSLTQAMVGLYTSVGNINFIDTSANGASGITLGQSTAYLNLGLPPTNVFTAVSTDVQIIALSPRPNNAYGVLNNYAIVKINSRAFQN